MAIDKITVSELGGTRIIENEVPSLDKKYIVTFKYNRSFDLYIGNKFFHFEPNESKDTFTEADIQHPDFIQQTSNFSVREI